MGDTVMEFTVAGFSLMLSAISPGVRILLPVTGIVWAVFEVRQAMQQRPEARSADGGSRLAVRFSTLLGVVGAVVCKRTLHSGAIGTQATAEWIGLVFLWCGVGLRIWSFLTLGRYFTFTVQTSHDQPVISTGPYRVIRHPGYAGILLAVVGLGFVINNWASLLVLTGAIAAGLIYRITVEERALSSDLGGRYQSYAEGRKRLVPLVW
jgi:protein-S-isoprenylcysteine O-methyltransferase Ste14